MMLRHGTMRCGFVVLAAAAGLCLSGLEALAQSTTRPYDPYVGSASDPKRDLKEIINGLNHAVCWINISASRNGAGWVIDTSQRLVVTTRQVIRDAKYIVVYFPEMRFGKWETDSGYYLKSAKSYSAKVIASDFGDDLALLQLDSLPAGAVALKLAPKRAVVSDKVHVLSAMTSGTRLWQYNFGTVHSTGRGAITNRWKMDVFVAKMFVNKHSLGEPMVNDQGHVIGIAEGETKTDVNGTSLGYGVTGLRAIDESQMKYWLGVSLPYVNPKTAEDYFKRGKKHVDERRYDQALEDLSNALSRDSTLTKVYAQRGWAYYGKNQYTAALAEFEKGAGANSRDDDALYGRGMAHRMLKKKTEAMRDFTAAIAVNPRDFKYFNQRGILYYSDRKYVEALKEFTSAAALTKTDYVVYENQGRTALVLKDYPTAKTAFGAANRLNPGVAANQNYEGVCYFRTKDFKYAATKFELAVKFNDKVNTYHRNLADAYRELGRHKEAVAEYSHAIRISSYADSTMYHDRAVSRIALKDYTDAVSDLTTAISKNGSYADAYYQRARAYAFLGRTAEAKADLDKAKSLNNKEYGTKTLADLTKAPTGGAVKQQPAPNGNKLAGRWHFRQKLNGKVTEIDLSMNADGSYTSKITVFNAAGAGTPAVETGTYRTSDGKLSLNPKVGKSVSRSFGFEGTKLWIFFPENKVVVYFERK